MARHPCVQSAGIVGVLVIAALAPAQGSGGLGGAVAGPSAGAPSDCIPMAQRLSAQARVAAFRLAHPDPEGLPAPPTFDFFPQAGTTSHDLFIGDFVDLDPTAGILAWNCSGHTRDGHHGSDCELRSFGEQAIGVPVFAAADGVVAATHDGEPDMNTQQLGQSSNYVIIAHAGGRDSWYWHLKNGSVAVSVGQAVKAGQQIGLTASSGNSGGPHLHWEIQDAAAVREPWAGGCRPGPSLFTNQPAYDPGLYVRDFAVSRTAPTAADSYPFPGPRSSHFAMTDGSLYFWILLQNVPANQAYTVRFKRPDGVVSLQSGPWPLNNPTWNYAWWWFNWYVWEMHVVPGVWTLEFELNGTIVVTAPIDVLPAFDPAFNRAPEPITISIDPSAPGTGDSIACRVGGSLVLDDRDWDIVRYQYVWKVNGQIVRSLTSAGKLDRLPHHAAQAGDVVTCEVTPSDGSLSGAMASASVTVQALASNHPTVSLAQGGDVTLTLDLGPAWALAPFATVGSLTGASPGVAVAPGVVVPLVVDSWTLMMVNAPNAPPYANAIGTLNGQGVARTHILVPAGLPASLAGAMAWHASLAVGTAWVASNAVMLTAVP